MAFFCPSKQGKSRPRPVDPPETPVLPRHINPGQTISTQRRSTVAREPKKVSCEAQMTSSAGQLEALIRKETARKQLVGLDSVELDADLKVIQNFAPSRKEELLAFKNDQLKEIRRLGEWVYAMNVKNGLEGYIPASYCSAIKVKDDWSVERKWESSRPDVDASTGQVRNLQETGLYYDPIDFSHRNNAKGQKVYATADSTPFVKEKKGLLVLLYDFEALNENDLECEKGHIVTLLNDDDPDWYWVCHADETLQGFVPSNFTRSYEEVMEVLEIDLERSTPRNRRNPLSYQPNKMPFTYQSLVSSENQPKIDKGINFQRERVLNQPLQVQTSFPDQPRGASGFKIPYQSHDEHQEEHLLTASNRSATSVIHKPIFRGSTWSSTQRQIEEQPQIVTPATRRRHQFGSLSGGQGKESFREFVVAEKHDAKDSQQLSVVRGETILVDTNQINLQSNWTWAHSLRTNTLGYIPSALLMHPKETF